MIARLFCAPFRSRSGARAFLIGLGCLFLSSAVIWKRSDFDTAIAYVNHHLILVRTTQIAFNWGQFISLIFHWFLINLRVD